MTDSMSRIPEPERMTEEEEIFYAKADYSVPHEALAREIVETVGPGGKWALDIGCGPGDVLLRIRRHAPDWVLVGADISPQMLTIASDDEAARLPPEASGINWVLVRGQRFAFPPRQFDVVISNSVLHHVAAPLIFWAEIKRLCRPGAHVFVRDLRRPESDVEAWAIINRNIPNESEVVRNHYFSSLRSSYTRSEVEAHLGATGIAGLKVVELEDRYLSVQGAIEA